MIPADLLALLLLLLLPLLLLLQLQAEVILLTVLLQVTPVDHRACEPDYMPRSPQLGRRQKALWLLS
jgi:hypothetical protein